MEFEPLFLEIEHKIGKLEKMAQRFTGVTESVDEFQRRIEKESKQQQSINKALFDLKKKQDIEQDRIRRGLSPAQAELEKAREKEAMQAQRKLFAEKGGELNKYHNEQMKYLNEAYVNSNDQNSLTYKQREILNKKRGSIELDEDEINDANKKDNNISDDDDDDDITVSDMSHESRTNPSTNENETRRLESKELSKKQKTLNRLKQRKDIKTEQIELIEFEHKWFRRHTNFLYSSDDLEFIFSKHFKLTVTDFDKINRIDSHPLDSRVEFIKELNRDVLNEKDKGKTGGIRGHIRHIDNQTIDTNIPHTHQQHPIGRISINSIQQHHRRQTSLMSRSGVQTSLLIDDEDEQEQGVFHIRFNGVCTFSAYDFKKHRLPIDKQKFKFDIQQNHIKGKRITISRYIDRMTHNEKVTCWIKLDEYLQECLVNVHNMRAINIYENEESESDGEEEKEEEQLVYNTYHAIFMSKRISLRRPQCDRIIVLCPQHKQHIRHGLWTRSASLCGNLAFGTMLNYIYTGRALNSAGKNSLWSAKHFDYVIAEPNCFVLTSAVDDACPGGTFPVIPTHNNNSKAHFEWLWDKYLVHKPRAKIFWIGHCEGCDDIKYLLSVRPSAASRTAGIVFMDYCIGSASKDLIMSVEAAAAAPINPINNIAVPNPAYGRFFNGKTDNWYIKPIVINTQKYPSSNNTNYNWEKEQRGNFSDTNQLASAPVLLLYSVNTNWRFTPCLSMYIINKYLLSRGIIDDEYLWKTNKERFEYLKNIRTTNTNQNNNMPFIMYEMKEQQNNSQLLLSAQSKRNIFNMSEFKEDIQPIIEPNIDEIMHKGNMSVQYNTIPDHLLPAAHEQSMHPIINNRNVYNKLPPKLFTIDAMKEQLEREKEQERLRLEAIALAERLAAEAEQKRLEEEAKAAEEEDDDGKGKKKKKHKKGKRDKKDKKRDKKGKDKKKDKKDKKKKKKKGKKGDDNSDDDGGDDDKKKSKKNKKKKRDKKKKKSKK